MPCPVSVCAPCLTCFHWVPQRRVSLILRSPTQLLRCYLTSTEQRGGMISSNLLLLLKYRRLLAFFATMADCCIMFSLALLLQLHVPIKASIGCYRQNCCSSYWGPGPVIHHCQTGKRMLVWTVIYSLLCKLLSKQPPQRAMPWVRT